MKSPLEATYASTRYPDRDNPLSWIGDISSRASRIGSRAGLESVGDTTAPPSVLGLALQGSLVRDSYGVDRVSILATWLATEYITTDTEPTTSPAISPVAGYHISYAIGTSGWTADVYTTLLTATLPGLDAVGQTVLVRVRAVSANGVPGAYALGSIMVGKDLTPPPVPSVPILKSHLKQITAEWDGLFAGGAAKPNDFLHVLVEFSVAGSDMMEGGTLAGPGIYGIPVTGLSDVYVQFRSVDNVGNISEASPTAFIAASPVFTADIYDDAVNAAKIADAAITTTKIAADAVTAGKIAALAVGSTHLAALAVTAEKVAANAITVAKIADDAVNAAKIADGAITSSHLALLAVTADRVAAGAITTDKIGTNAITLGKIAAGAVSQESLNFPIESGPPGPGSITTTMITDGAISTPKIAALAVAADKIAANAIIAGKIAAGAVQAGTIAAGAIVTGDLAAGAVTALKIAAGTITATEIAADTITAAKIAADAITATELAAGAVTAGKIFAGSITTGDLGANVVTAAKIAAGTITATEIAADTITAAKIAAGAITASELAAGSVQAGKLAAGAVQAGEIAAGAITSGTIASNSITATEIAAGAINASELNAGAVNATHLVAGSIGTNALAANSVTTNEIAAGSITADRIQAQALDGRTLSGNTINGAKFRSDRYNLFGSNKNYIEMGDFGSSDPADEIRFRIGVSIASIRSPGLTNVNQEQGTLIFSTGRESGAQGAIYRMHGDGLRGLDVGSARVVTTGGFFKNGVEVVGGTQGPQGPQGIQGIQGPQGPQGPAGTVGTHDHSGQTVAASVYFCGTTRMMSNSGSPSYFFAGSDIRLGNESAAVSRNLANSVYRPMHASAFTVNSSEANKDQISDAPRGVLENVKKMRPVKYLRKGDPASTPRSRGFLAEEVALLAPDLVVPMKVTGRDKGTDEVVVVEESIGIDLMAALSFAIQAIQELSAEVDALKTAR